MEKTNLTESTGEGKQAKRDERHKKALAGGGQKGGAGRGSRESSTKKTKNKYRDRMKGGEDEEVTSKKNREEKELQFLTQQQVSGFYTPCLTDRTGVLDKLDIG